jgi:hypothetical protein
VPKRKPPELTPEQLKEKFLELGAQPELAGYLFVGVIGGRVIGMWGAETEMAGLMLQRDGAESLSHIADWLAKGGMRPAPGREVH